MLAAFTQRKSGGAPGGTTALLAFVYLFAFRCCAKSMPFINRIHIINPRGFMVSFFLLFSCRRKMSSKTTLALLIFGIMMHHSVSGTPAGLSFASVRYVHFNSSTEFDFCRCWGLCCGAEAMRFFKRHSRGGRLKSTSPVQLTGIIA